MEIRRIVLVALVFCLVLTFSSVLMAQEEKSAPAAESPMATTAESALEEAAGSEQPAAKEEMAAEAPGGKEAAGTEWIWGEVVSVDPKDRRLEIKHLDYETYEEVATTLKIDDKTLFENVADLGDIKAGDHVTMDYRTVGGSNVAELIVVEKEGAQTAVPEAETAGPVSAEAPVANETAQESATE